jgi:hypothetical protein
MGYGHYEARLLRELELSCAFPFACYFLAELLERRPATPGAYLNTSSNAAMDRGRLLCGLFRAVSASAADLRFLDQEGEKRGWLRRRIIAFPAN